MAEAPATILFVGDVVGGIGRRTLLGLLPALAERREQIGRASCRERV